MSRSVGRVAPVFVTTVRVVWFPARWCTIRSHSICPLMATSSCAVRGPRAMSSLICETFQLAKRALPAEVAFFLPFRAKWLNEIVRIVPVPQVR